MFQGQNSGHYHIVEHICNPLSTEHIDGSRKGGREPLSPHGSCRSYLVM